MRSLQTLRAGCSKAEPENFTPPQTPFRAGHILKVYQRIAPIYLINIHQWSPQAARCKICARLAGLPVAETRSRWHTPQLGPPIVGVDSDSVQIEVLWRYFYTARQSFSKFVLTCTDSAYMLTVNHF